MTDDDTSEHLTITYQGYGEMFTASLHNDAGLDAQKSYEWLVRAIRAIGFDQLAKLVEQRHDQ